MSFHEYMYGQYLYYHGKELALRDKDDVAAEENARVADMAMDAVLTAAPTDQSGINVLLRIADEEMEESGSIGFIGGRAIKMVRTVLDRMTVTLQPKSGS